MDKIADTCNQFLGKGEKLAMFSNEPEIYFYTHHVAASPWLYSYPFFETHPYSVEMMRDYINSINANRGNFFLAFQPNLPGLSGEAAKIFNDWWTNYRKNFELIAVYNIVSGDSGHFMRRPELDIDTSWKPGGSFQYWVRK